MGQVLHGCATTTEAVRRAIQHSQESLRALARRYGINQKTVAKWKKRGSVADLPTGPKDAEVHGAVDRGRGDRSSPSAGTRCCRSTTAFMPLQPTIPHLTRSSLHRCLQRHGISRCRRSKATLGQAQVQDLPDRLLPHRHRRGAHREGKLYLLVAIDRTSKFAFVELHEKVARETAGDFLRRADRRRSLQGPHGPDRQRYALHHAGQYQLGSARHQNGSRRRRARLGACLRICLRQEPTSIIA